ncbi:MAG: MarR family transcriptional regulator [Caulobacteraceae bacterium]|jgi:DNA-binding MarR family transcriptional regulator|nr:MarR family transcriptional regulator [Caulobacteraceae bacterium]
MKPHVETWLINLKNGNIQTKTERVLAYIKNNSGCTIIDIKEDTGINHQTVTGALSQIMDAGLVERIGEKHINGNVYSSLMFIHDSEKRARLVKDREDERLAKLLATIDDLAHRLPEIQRHINLLKIKNAPPQLGLFSSGTFA